MQNKRGSDLPEVVPNMWPMKTSTNFSREEVLALEDVGF
jgi:hypothetical protein